MKFKRIFKRYFKYPLVFLGLLVGLVIGLPLLILIGSLLFLLITGQSQISGHFGSGPIILYVGLFIFLVLLPFIIKAEKRKKGVQFKKDNLEVWLNERYSNVHYDVDKYFLTKEAGYCERYSNCANIVNANVFTPYDIVEYGYDFFSWYTKRGTPFQYCNVSVRKERRINEVFELGLPVFKGGLLATTSAKALRIKSPIVIQSKGLESNEEYILPKNKLMTESEQFNKNFICYCDTEESFFFMIYPSILEKLLEIEKIIGEFSLHISTSGAVVISGPDFELFPTNKSINNLKQTATQSITIITEFVKDLEKDLNLALDNSNLTIPLILDKDPFNKNCDSKTEGKRIYTNYSNRW